MERISVRPKEEEVIAAFSQAEGIILPANKTQMRILKSHLQAVSPEEPLTIFVGSCPDYSNDGSLYTHESLGEGLPLLTQLHLKHAKDFLKILDQFDVPYEYIIMVADVEAIDEIFCQRFSGGDENEFLRRCESSIEATADHIGKMNGKVPFKGIIRSSSFFREFGREEFLNLQYAYQAALQEQYCENGSFSSRVQGDIVQRMGMYEKMYRGVMDEMNNKEMRDFLASRTMRTMAQYLTLGRLITDAAKYPIVINHPTRNIGVYNQRNKFLLPGDGPHPQPTLPIFQMVQKVY